MCGCLPFQGPCFQHRSECNVGNWTALFDHSFHAHFSRFEKCPRDEKQISELVQDAKHGFHHSSILQLCFRAGNVCVVFTIEQRLDLRQPDNRHSFICHFGFLLHLHFYSYVEKRSCYTKENFSRRQTSSVLKLCIAAAVGGFSFAAMQIYALMSVHRALYDVQNSSPWNWFAFTTSLRCLEMGMSLLLYTTGTINIAGQRVRGRINVASLSMMQSKVKSRVTEICTM